MAKNSKTGKAGKVTCTWTKGEVGAILRIEGATEDTAHGDLFRSSKARSKLASRFWTWATTAAAMEGETTEEKTHRAQWAIRTEAERGRWLFDIIAQGDNARRDAKSARADLALARAQLARLEALALALGAEQEEIDDCFDIGGRESW